MTLGRLTAWNHFWLDQATTYRVNFYTLSTDIIQKRKLCPAWLIFQISLQHRHHRVHHHFHYFRVEFQLASHIMTEVRLFSYVIYSSTDAHWWHCVSAGEWITQPNRLTLLIMVLKRWNLARMIAEMMANTMVWVGWRYLKHLRRDVFFLGKTSFNDVYLPHYSSANSTLPTSNPDSHQNANKHTQNITRRQLENIQKIERNTKLRLPLTASEASQHFIIL